MGWKSTIQLTRKRCLELIHEALGKEETTDECIEYTLEAVLGGGDHGHNYMIIDEDKPKDMNEYITCRKCGVEFKEVMGFVCGDGDCPIQPKATY